MRDFCEWKPEANRKLFCSYEINTYWGPSFMMLCGFFKNFFKDHFRLDKSACNNIHAYVHQGYI